MKARTHAAAAVLAFAALPLVLVEWSGFEDRRDAAARNSDLVLSGNTEELSSLLVAARSRWLESVRADAHLPGLEDLLLVDPPPDPVRLSRFFGAVGSRDAVNIRSIGLIDLKGRVLEDSHAADRGRDESLEPWFLRAMDTGQPQIVGPHTPAGATAPGLYLAALVRDAAEQRRGLLRVRMEPSALAQVLASALVASPGLSATLVDADGRALIGVGPLGDVPLPLDAATGAQAPQILDIGAERVSVAPVAHSPWRTAVRQPLAAWSTPQQALRREWLIETMLLLVLLLAASLLLGQRIAAPLARFSAIAGRMAEGDFGPVPRWPGADEARQLGDALDGLATRLRETIGSLSRELEQRREAEAALRESRGQYLALVERLPGAVYRCANRPGWPMDYLSPQIEQLTGHAPQELLADGAQGFAALIPEEDVAAITAALSEAARSTRRFELRYRIRHRDGRLRWIRDVGSVNPGPQDPDGQLTGVMFDITDRETAHQAMDLLRGGIETQVGGDFFAALAGGLARMLEVDAVMIGRFRGDPPDRLRSLALVDRGGTGEQVEFPIAGTPTAAVLAHGALEVLDDVGQRFPDDADLVHRRLRAYIGRRLDDRRGRPIGVLALLDGRPMAGGNAAARLLDLFQARAAAELERVLAEEDLQRLADTLEHRVAERTRELEAANESLSQAMKQLVQREKLASLGSLVAGVAHELNTPIGNALTVSTALNDIHRQFTSDFGSGQLKRSSLEKFVRDNSEAAALIERNLQRAASLISHFKQVAVDQASMRRRHFDLAEVVQDVLSTLSPRLKRSPHEVQVDIPHGLCMESYPGPLEQVLTNLVENSLVHAFGPCEIGRIRISARAEDGRVGLRYEDNGCGVPVEVRHRIFDPFFTTRLGQGGSGLGLYLVYNLVHGRLGGSIRLTDCEGRGTCFIVDLPVLAPAAAEESME